MTYKNEGVKQLVILSGKGGTGKTTLSAALIHLSHQSAVPSIHADTDVDAANLALVTNAKPVERHPFSNSAQAQINDLLCTNCGICDQVCRFDAINPPTGYDLTFQVDDLQCDGCAACVYTCPESAIKMVAQDNGEWYHAISDFGHQFHAELYPGAENSGKLVTMVKQNAKLYGEDHQSQLMIVDGPPGIGCPVISASAGAHIALLVAEPGLSGQHDLLRIIQTLQHFEIPIMICINKADIYPEGTADIHQMADEMGYPVIGEIPFDKAIPDAMIRAKAVTASHPTSPAAVAIKKIWMLLKETLLQGA
jgi:MinD superfamily P-loop ATPase